MQQSCEVYTQIEQKCFEHAIKVEKYRLTSLDALLKDNIFAMSSLM